MKEATKAHSAYMKGNTFRRGTTTSAAGRANLSRGKTGNKNGCGPKPSLYGHKNSRKYDNPSSPLKRQRESQRATAVKRARDVKAGVHVPVRTKKKNVGWLLEEEKLLAAALNKHGDKYAYIASSVPGFERFSRKQVQSKAQALQQHQKHGLKYVSKSDK